MAGSPAPSVDYRIELNADARGVAEADRAWPLYRAALIKVLNRQRYWAAEKRELGRARPIVDDDSTHRGEKSPAGDGPTPSDDALTRERLELLQRAFEQLDEEQQAIIFLAYVEELPHKDTASRLGVTESHSRSKLSRAVARLARIATSS